MKKVSLLEMNDAYVQSAWAIKDEEMQVIAIYRKLGDKFALCQLRGPWSHYDPETRNVIDTETSERSMAAVEAIDLLGLLNKRPSGLDAVKLRWKEAGASVYDM